MALGLVACTSAGQRAPDDAISFDDPAWLQAPPPPREAPIVAPGALHRSALPNGLHVIVLEDHRLPYASIGIAVRRGAAIESTGERGVAALTAEVMERGAGDRNALALASLLDALGADFSVSAGWDAMTVSLGGLSRDVDTLFGVLADVALRPRFDADEVRKARDEAIANLERAADEPETLVGWYRARAVYGEHRYGWPVGGTPQSVARLGADALRAFHARVFEPPNAIVFASGDVDAARFAARVQQAFGDWPVAPVPPPVTPPPALAPPARKVVIVDKPDLVQARIALSHEGIARSDERRISASLMSDVLGGSGFSSRLMKSVRSEAGLTYSVWSGFGMRRAPGPFVVETFTRVPEVRRTIDLLLDEVDRMRREPPTGEELAKARSYAVGRFGLSLETSARVLSRLVELDVEGLPEDTLDRYRSRVRAVSESDVAEVARELLHPERAAIVVVGPAAELEAQLEGLGPIEILTP